MRHRKTEPEKLQAQHVELLAERARAVAEAEEADKAQRPYAEAFQIAHHKLLELTRSETSTKQQRLAGYDRRMNAGHAWHPFRSRLTDAMNWLKAIGKELADCRASLAACVEREIERCPVLPSAPSDQQPPLL